MSLFDGMAEWLAVPLLHYDYAGRIQPRVGINHATISPYGAYRCGDGLEVVLAIQNEREWARLCDQVLGDAKLVDDARLASNVARVANRDYVDELIGRVFAGLNQDEAIERLQDAGIAYGRLNDMAGLARHPQLRRRLVDTPSGEARVVDVAARRSGKPAHVAKVPALGEHSRALRDEFS